MLGSVLIKSYLLVLMVVFPITHVFIKALLGFKVVSLLSFLRTGQAEQFPHGGFGAVAAELTYFFSYFCMLFLFLPYWLKICLCSCLRWLVAKAVSVGASCGSSLNS